MCAAAQDGDGVLVATADGEVVTVTSSGETRTIIDGLPCITAMALGNDRLEFCVFGSSSFQNPNAKTRNCQDCRAYAAGSR